LGTVELRDSSIVILNKNNFTFEDFEGIDLTKVVDFSAINQSVQVANVDSIKNVGDEFLWQLEFDQNVNSTYYLWYKDSLKVDSTTIGELSIEKLLLQDQGSYYCEVRNTNFPDLTINVKPIELIVNSVEKEPVVFSPNGDGVNDEYFFEYEGVITIYNQQGKLVKELSAPTEWNGYSDNAELLSIGTYIFKLDGEFIDQITIIQ